MSVLKSLGKLILSQPVFAPLFAGLLARRLELLHDSDAPDALNVLVFSSFRWEQDLEALAREGGVRLYAIDRPTMQWINALFSVPNREPHAEYFLESDAEILRQRARHSTFVATLVRALLRRQRLDCAVTSAVHYRQEHCWAAGCDRAGLPFIALHKEFTILDDRHLPERIERFRGRGQKFLGSHVTVTNETAKTLFAESGVFPAEKIDVVGLLRMDNLLAFDGAPRRPKGQAKPCVTLFSFGHLCGGVTAPWRSHYFSLNDDAGFVDLFRNVHVAFAEAALRNPEATFKIKPKNVQPWWTDEIEKVIAEDLGMPLDAIPNCSIVDEPAPDLIAESAATIGFNSTVLIESRTLNCNTIMPCFDEAVGDYTHNVFFPDFRDVFAIADSKADLIVKLEHALAGEPLHPDQPDRVKALCRAYIGFDDGRTAARVMSVLRGRAMGTGSAEAPDLSDAA